MRRRPVAIAAATAALGGLCAAAAMAVAVRDRDDVAIGFDMAKASGSHNRVSDELVHAIDFYDPLQRPLTTPPSSVCVEIWTRSTPGESAPDYEACAVPNAKGKGWKGSIARKRELGPQLRLASVKVEQPSATRIVLRIDPDLIKRPASYRWRAETTSFAKDCKVATGCPDYAPDRPTTAETSLGKPRT